MHRLSLVRRYRRRDGGDERGAAMVEFALVLPLLLVLVFGIVDFGRAFQSWITLTNAAREGARLGATGAKASDICARVTTTAALAGVSCSVDNAQGTTGTSVKVTAGYTLKFITPVGPLLGLLGGSGFKTTYNLTSTADMRLE
jgi:Flp pilus assembly protein TadG